jgi:hypothetical protein
LWKFWYSCLPSFSNGYASSNWWRFQYLVVPLPPCGLPLFCCMLAKYFGSCLLFLFLSLAWVLSFYFSRPFLAFLDYIYIFLNVWICGIFSICDSKEQRYEGIKHHDVYTRNMYCSLARRLGWGKGGWDEVNWMPFTGFLFFFFTSTGPELAS